MVRLGFRLVRARHTRPHRCAEKARRSRVVSIHAKSDVRWRAPGDPRLVDDSVFQLRQVGIYENNLDIPENPPGDSYAAIMARGGSYDQPALAGGGLDANSVTDTVEIRVYHRLRLDQHRRATAWTIDPCLSAYRQARFVAKALHLKDLLDQSGNILTSEPIRILTLRDSVSLQNGWGYVPVTLEVKYTSELLLTP